MTIQELKKFHKAGAVIEFLCAFPNYWVQCTNPSFRLPSNYYRIKSPMKNKPKTPTASAKIAPITLKFSASDTCLAPTLATMTTDQLKKALRDRKLPIHKLKSEMVKELDDCLCAVSAPVTITIA